MKGSITPISRRLHRLHVCIIYPFCHRDIQITWTCTYWSWEVQGWPIQRLLIQCWTRLRPALMPEEPLTTSGNESSEWLQYRISFDRLRSSSESPEMLSRWSLRSKLRGGADSKFPYYCSCFNLEWRQVESMRYRWGKHTTLKNSVTEQINSHKKVGHMKGWYFHWESLVWLGRMHFEQPRSNIHL